VDTFEELRALQCDLTELGGHRRGRLAGTRRALLPCLGDGQGRAVLGAGPQPSQESLLEPPVSGVARYFATCALAIA
jgi:hypothetical protein